MSQRRLVLLVYNDYDGDSRVERTARIALDSGYEVFVLAKASKRYPPCSLPRIINGVKVIHVDESALRAPPLIEVVKEVALLLWEATKFKLRAFGAGGLPEKRASSGDRE